MTFTHRFRAVLATLCLIHRFLVRAVAAEDPPDFADLIPVLVKHCVECHDTREPEGSLVLNHYDALMKGGSSGPVVLPLKSEESLLIKYLEGRVEKDGKQRFMPPGNM